jgi:hypothetical protein
MQDIGVVHELNQIQPNPLIAIACDQSLST